MQLALSLLLALPASDGHAALHPGDAELYVEIPDVPALVAAYRTAPLVSFFADEELAPLRELLPEGFGLAAVGGELSGRGIPVPGILAAAEGLTAVSLSLRGVCADPSLAQAGAEIVLGFRDAEAAAAAFELLDALPLAGAELVLAGADAAKSYANAGGACVLRQGALVALFLGTAEPAAFLARPAAASLAQRTEHAQASLHLREQRGAVVFRGAGTLSPRAVFLVPLLASSAMRERFLAQQAHPLMRVAGLLDEDAGAFQMRAVPAGFVWERFRRGERPALTHPRALESLSTDTAVAWASGFDRDAIGALLAFALDELGGRFGRGLALDPALLGSLGSRMLLYLPAPSGLTLPRFELRVELADPAAFGGALERWTADLRAALGEKAVGTRTYRDQVLTSFTTPLPMLDPTLAVQGSELLVTLQASVARRALRDAEERERGFRARAEVAPRAEELSSALGFVFVDWPAILSGYWRSALTFAELGASQMQLPFELEQLPGPEIFARHFRPTVGVWTRVEGGVHTRIETSFGPETWAGLTLGPAILVPRLFLRLGEANENKARSDIFAIYGALESYAIDHGGQFPTELSDLFELDPSGTAYLDVGASPLDPWGNPYVYVPPSAGKPLELYSLGGDGQPGGEGPNRDITYESIKRGE